MQIHGDVVRVGIHSGQLHGTYDACQELWTRAEQLGYDWVSVIDHLRPHVYAPDFPCFEGTTLLAALAAKTPRVRCSILVSTPVWRHPALLANIAATIDHVCSGRLEFGLGAGGSDRAYQQYGMHFPDFPTRLGMLDEACTVVRSLWSQETATFAGKYFSLERAHLAPKPLQKHLPLIVGGDGVRRTLRIAARHADIWNSLAQDQASYACKLEALAAHCRAENRSPTDIRKSITFRAVLGGTSEAAIDRASKLLQGVPDEVRSEYLTVGTAESCFADLTAYVRLGVRDFLLAVKPPIDWQTVERFAEEVAPRLRAHPEAT